jgi:hypothetical protein
VISTSQGCQTDPHEVYPIPILQREAHWPNQQCRGTGRPPRRCDAGSVSLTDNWP